MACGSDLTRYSNGSNLRLESRCRWRCIQFAIRMDSGLKERSIDAYGNLLSALGTVCVLLVPFPLQASNLYIPPSHTVTRPKHCSREGSILTDRSPPSTNRNALTTGFALDRSEPTLGQSHPLSEHGAVCFPSSLFSFMLRKSTFHLPISSPDPNATLERVLSRQIGAHPQPIGGFALGGSEPPTLDQSECINGLVRVKPLSELGAFFLFSMVFLLLQASKFHTPPSHTVTGSKHRSREGSISTDRNPLSTNWNAVRS